MYSKVIYYVLKYAKQKIDASSEKLNFNHNRYASALFTVKCSIRMIRVIISTDGRWRSSLTLQYTIIFSRYRKTQLNSRCNGLSGCLHAFNYFPIILMDS